jgi:hypothetical protein
LSDTAPIPAHRWRENWRALTPDGAVHVELAHSRASRRSALAAVGALAPGSSVVVSSSAPRAAARCRAFASAAGLELERAYLAFPTATAPAYLVEDAPASLRLFTTNVLAAPPRTRFSLPIEVGVALLRALKSWRLVRALAPGRVVVGRRR